MLGGFYDMLVSGVVVCVFSVIVYWLGCSCMCSWLLFSSCVGRLLDSVVVMNLVGSVGFSSCLCVVLVMLSCSCVFSMGGRLLMSW